MKKVLLPAAILGLVIASTASAVDPGDTLWTKVYGGLYNESAFSVQQTDDSGYIIVGYSYTFGPGNYDAYLMKTDSAGDTLWTRTFGGSDSDYGTAVQQTIDGGYVFAGYSSSFGPGGYGGYLVKTDANGDTLWTRSFGGDRYDHLHSVQQTGDGGYIVAGRSNSFTQNEDYDVYLVRTDADGDTVWTKTYGGSEWDEGYTVRQTTDNGYVIVGHTDSFSGGHRNIWLLKTDADGDTLWTRTYGGSTDLASRSVRQTTDDGYIIAGQTDPHGGGSADVVLLKTDTSGTPEWARLYGWDNDQMPNCVEQTDDGGYIFAGYGWSGGDNWYDVYVGKTSSSGSLQWESTYGGNQDEHAQAVALTNDGNYIVVGDTRSYGAGAGDYYILKIAGAGPLPDVGIEVTPDDDPLVVPKGGSFWFTASLVNNGPLPAEVDVWTMAAGPFREIFGPFMLFYDVQVPPGDSITGHLEQRVPGRAPSGLFDYIAFCGEYPDIVYDSSSFSGEVIEGEAAVRGGLDWLLEGTFQNR